MEYCMICWGQIFHGGSLFYSGNVLSITKANTTQSGFTLNLVVIHTLLLLLLLAHFYLIPSYKNFVFLMFFLYLFKFYSEMRYPVNRMLTAVGSEICLEFCWQNLLTIVLALERVLCECRLFFTVEAGKVLLCITTTIFWFKTFLWALSICQTGRSDRPVCKSNVSWCHNYSENGTHYFEEIRRTRIKLILQIIKSRLRTDQSGKPVLTNWKRLYIVK